jgi:hypothetical protein
MDDRNLQAGIDESSVREVANRPDARKRARHRLNRPKRSPIRLAAESLLIVVSVLLAFGLNEWRMQRAEATLARNVIDGLYREIESNLALLETMQPLHASLADSLAAVDLADLRGRPAFAIVSERRSMAGRSSIRRPRQHGRRP